MTKEIDLIHFMIRDSITVLARFWEAPKHAKILENPTIMVLFGKTALDESQELIKKWG